MLNRFTIIIIGIVSFVSISAFAKLPKILQEVENKYSKAATLSADFTQVNETAAFKHKKQSSGHLLAKRPNKIRWETLQPDPSLLVSDGKRFWHYTPPFEEGDRGQVIERKSYEVQSKLANALLSGSFSMAREMKVQQLGPSQFILLPKRGTAGTIARAEVQINPKQKVIEKVILEHHGGNRSEITLSNIELGHVFADDVFYFVPPPNTDPVKE